MKPTGATGFHFSLSAGAPLSRSTSTRLQHAQIFCRVSFEEPVLRRLGKRLANSRNLTLFSRYLGTSEPDTAQRQERQIVQS